MNYNSGFQFGTAAAFGARRQRSRLTLPIGTWTLMTRVAAATALCLLTPIFLAVWILQKLFDPGPFLFKQIRPGYKGNEFTIYKIRTMKIDAESKTPLGTTNSSSQVTRLGRLLRALKIDETPQLLNVAKGEMAIVGPRPIPTPLHTELSAKIANFESRYEVRPGLTSIGQICIRDNALGDELINDWRIRFEGEIHYIKNRSMSYDLILIGMTTAYVFKKLLNQ